MITATRLDDMPYTTQDDLIVAVKTAEDAEPPTQADLQPICDTIAVEGDEALWLLHEAPIDGAWAELYDQVIQVILYEAAVEEMRWIDHRMSLNAL